MTKLLVPHKQDVETILNQYLGPKPAKEAAKQISDILQKVAVETQAQMVETIETALARALPTAAAPAKRKAATRKASAPAQAVSAKPKAKAKPKAPAEPKAAPKVGKKALSKKTSNSQKVTKQVYWALVRHFKKDPKPTDKAFIQEHPEIAKEQRDGAKRRAEQLLAPQAVKKPKKDKAKTKAPNGAVPVQELDDSVTAALNL